MSKTTKRRRKKKSDPLKWKQRKQEQTPLRNRSNVCRVHNVIKTTGHRVHVIMTSHGCTFWGLFAQVTSMLTFAKSRTSRRRMIMLDYNLKSNTTMGASVLNLTISGRYIFSKLLGALSIV